MDKLKLGIIGLSDGNGHPYSWSAIFNGYDDEYMKDCPWPGIYDYLSKQIFPKDQLVNAEVTHIWTQDYDKSAHIAKASKIKNVVHNIEDLVGKVDAILLARDDAENHFEMAKPFIENGIPIFIDKPLAYTVKEAERIFNLAQYNWQIYSCSALRYANEFSLNKIKEVGDVKLIHATIPKSWNKYAVHIIEPTIQLIPNRGDIKSIQPIFGDDLNVATIEWESGIKCIFQTMGSVSSPININVYGSKNNVQLVFKDSYSAFKESLNQFILGIKNKQIMISREETMEIITIIEEGKYK